MLKHVTVYMRCNLIAEIMQSLSTIQGTRSVLAAHLG